MDWWNDLTDWTASDDGWRVISGAIIPFVAIVVAGIVAAFIGRGAAKRVVAMQERESRNAAVAAIISAARKASTWGSLGHDERAYADHLAEDADIRLRLLPVAGAPLAANWAQHEIADIKKNSSTFSFQAEQSLAEFRDRLLEWQARPGRARKLFKSDLERWKFDSPDPDAELIARQQDWNADQASGRKTPAAAETTDAPAERPTPTTTSLRPAPQRQSTGAAAGGVPSTAAAGSAGAGAGAGAAADAAPIAPAGFSVSRGSQAPVDPNATTPLSDAGADTTRSYGDGATRSYGDGATRPYGDDATTPIDSGAAVRPQLGSAARSDDDDAAPGRKNDLGRDTDNDDAVDDSTGTPSGASTPSRVAQPTSADAHVNRSSDSAATGVDGQGATTSVPTRIGEAPAEPADANETSEAPYTQPISANELRRRAADDDE